MLEDKVVEKVINFSDLGSIVDREERTDTNVKVCIGKARTAFKELGNVWKFMDLNTIIKIGLFNTICEVHATLRS